MLESAAQAASADAAWAYVCTARAMEWMGGPDFETRLYHVAELRTRIDEMTLRQLVAPNLDPGPADEKLVPGADDAMGYDSDSDPTAILDYFRNRPRVAAR